jgi:hypothetical protein
MPQEEKVSRYEVNRNVRMAITRHDADMTKIDYSFMGNTVYLYGDLVKSNGDFSAQEIESLASDISSLPHVRDIQFDLNNWKLVSSGDSWQVTKTGKSVATKGTGSSGDSTIIIEKSEKLADVLEDLQPDLKKENE